MANKDAVEQLENLAESMDHKVTRKDYTLIAEAVAAALSDPTLSGSHSMNVTARLGAKLVRDRLAMALEADNPRFDRNRFLKACEAE